MRHSYGLRLMPILLLAAVTHAQPVDSLVNEAMRNYPGLKSFDYQIQAAEFRSNAVQALPPPTLGLEFSQIPTNTLDVVNGAISNNLSVSQMFMLGGKLSSMGDVEKKRGRVLEQNRASFAVQLRAKVKMAYFRLWLLDRQIEVQQSTLRLLEDLAQTMQTRVLTNRMRQADLLTVQAEVAAERARLTSARTKRVSAQNELSSLLGRDGGASSVVTDSVFAPGNLVISEAQLEDRVRQLNPVLTGMDRMKEMNESEMAAAKSNLSPDLMIQAMVMRMPNGMILTAGERSAYAIQQSAMGMPMGQTDWMYSVMASITLPFVPWSAERSSSRGEEYRAMNASIDAEKSAMQRDMLSQLRSSMLKYMTADSLAREYSSSILPLMREAAEAQVVAYQTGQVPISTVLDARRMELMKRDDYLMVLVDREMALAEIEMMVGGPLM
jgi:outer membrane protein, heavy metal efflux system